MIVYFQLLSFVEYKKVYSILLLFCLITFLISFYISLNSTHSLHYCLLTKIIPMLLEINKMCHFQ